MKHNERSDQLFLERMIKVAECNDGQRRIQEFATGETDPGFQFGGGTWRAR